MYSWHVHTESFRRQECDKSFYVFLNSEKTYPKNPTADLDNSPLQESPLVFVRTSQDQRSNKFFAEIATAGEESLKLAVTFWSWQLKYFIKVGFQLHIIPSSCLFYTENFVTNMAPKLFKISAPLALTVMNLPILNMVHCKKVIVFPVPSRDFTNQT